MATPAIPPAIQVFVTLNSSSPGLAKVFLVTSYAAKYSALPGPSLANVAKDPLKSDCMPPSRTSHLAADTNVDLPVVCKTTLTRSVGAITSVVGIAEINPVVANWKVLSGCSDNTCPQATIFFPKS